MGPVGTPELVFIFILALLLFGPKELPKIGKTIGKAMTEFRRAQTELKSTFDREMKNLERETGMQELAQTTFQSDATYNYDASNYDPDPMDYEGSWAPTVPTTHIDGASATQGAATTAPLQIEAAAGSIANGHLEPAHGEHAQETASIPAAGHAEPGHSAPAETTEKVNV
jgi:sec-independent protein translocase protein TatA